jgi:hypothetical protein
MLRCGRDRRVHRLEHIYALSLGVSLSAVAFLASPLAAQQRRPDASAADALRLTVDARLVTAGEALDTDFRDVHMPELTLESDSTGNYGLLGAFIGWAVTAVPTVFFCLGIEDADSGGCVLIGATVGGLPGFVIGGLIGSSIEKSPGDDQDEAEQTSRPGGTGSDADPDGLSSAAVTGESAGWGRGPAVVTPPRGLFSYSE